jgi:hypothetical protein
MTTMLAAPLLDHSLPVPARVRYLVRPSFQSREAALWGVSRRVARLLTARALEPGTAVLLELSGPESACPCSQLARVTSAERAGEEGYVVQCRFARPLDTPGFSLILRELAQVGR